MVEFLLSMVFLSLVGGNVYLYKQLKGNREQAAITQTRLQEQLQKATQDRQRIQKHLDQYSGIIDKEDHEKKLADKISQLKQDISQLSEQKTILEEIVQALEEEDNLHTIAFYQPKHSFDDSAQYQSRLELIREQQKQLIKSGQAVTSVASITLEGSEKKGQKLVNNFIKLVLRAFNGESDAAIAKVKYNNISTQITRITKAFEAINKLAETTYCMISVEYFNSKLEELSLTHEYQEKKQEEIEEQRRIREQMKEEERALREIEKAKLDAEKEELRYQQSLEKARLEIEQATGKQRDKLEAQILQLTQQLQEAQKNKERAISRAQMTKSGHVYIISNIGAFGEHVYKIGMTRRLDPMDRVNELGDASVPFPFDVHAIIFCQNAPELEKLLHKHFHHRRVNKVNERKEFFKVDIEEIAEAVKQIAKETNSIQGEIHITKSAAAMDYRKTVAILEKTYQAK
jgi:hypothetical protein